MGVSPERSNPGRDETIKPKETPTGSSAFLKANELAKANRRRICFGKEVENAVSVLLEYAGGYKWLTFLGLFLSAIAMVLGMAPYLCIWLVARDLIAVAPDWTAATSIAKYGWMAFGFAVGGIVVYFGALLCTHLAAFRTASNIRKEGWPIS